MKRWKTDGFSRRRTIAAALTLLSLAIAIGSSAANAESPLETSSRFSPEKLARVGDYISQRDCDRQNSQTPSQRGRIQLALKTLIYEALGR